MSTSDERREIARRLRAAAKTKSNSVDYLWKRLEIAVNGWKFGDVIDESYVFDNDVLSRLADLIDPTCHIALDDWASQQCMGPMLSCDRCQAAFPEINSPYVYCPRCGARVVSGDDC